MIEPKAFRAALGRFPTGVSVVTGIDEDVPLGLTANSFTSVSLDPPLVSFCVGANSKLWPRLAACRSLAVNILGGHQEDVATTFARSGEDKFKGVAYEISPRGNPLLRGAVATFECVPFEHVAAGDHTIVILKVIGMSLHADLNSPLLFFSGRFGQFLTATTSTLLNSPNTKVAAL